ncbi:MAG: hypothetical protein RJB18_1145 [Pseudomonadota bacterium]|jgi:hypothetical protein
MTLSNGMSLVGALVFVGLLNGCATTPEQPPQIQRISAEELELIMPKPTPNLSLDEVVLLSKNKVPADEIIQKIKESQSQYALTPSQVLEMSKKGVDAKVLDYMQASHEQAIRDGFAEELNKREQTKLQEQQKLKREYQLRQPYYDPYWGYPYPYYGPRFRYQFGF